ncbi:hypothetical protein TKK_0001510 [Trichogramma kaykai]|uniref:phospholipase A1 n=1 Tax=Trichogramma kaykai TaxID=54128 RepID=A0ABD2X1C7_9HYME
MMGAWRRSWLSVAALFLFCGSLHLASANKEIDQYLGRKLNCWKPELTYDTFKVKFFFSSRKKSDQLYTLDNEFDSQHYDFKPHRRTAVLVHGFLGKIYGDPMRALKRHLLAWQNMNVIIVRWEEVCTNLFCYERAAADTEFVAKQIRLLFKSLDQHFVQKSRILQENWGHVHLIGHSLGAHTVGHAAKLLKHEDGFEIDRVTGLDPAEPCFETIGKAPLRLSNDSARFVDVIHTAVARSKNSAFGLLEPLGHADFYVNGGGPQPDCNKLTIFKVFRKQRTMTDLSYHKLFPFALNGGICDHFHSVIVFIESVKQVAYSEAKQEAAQCRFTARPWQLGSTAEQQTEAKEDSCYASSCPEMGINADQYEFPERTYLVSTTGKEPFCIVPAQPSNSTAS